MDFITGEILAVDKPLGWTSFDVVKRLRGALLRRLGLKKFKVGHAGTLDPLASGVMVVVTGRATKLIDSLQAGVKEYTATIRLGATTPSFRGLVEKTLPQFAGTIQQIPPAFSACKIDGKRAYNMARKGQQVELKPKTLVIDSIRLLDFNPEVPEITIAVTCSKGTYIRALARDIGIALGSGAHLTALRRTRVGDVTIDRCLSVDNAVELIRNTTLTFPENYEHKS